MGSCEEVACDAGKATVVASPLWCSKRDMEDLGQLQFRSVMFVDSPQYLEKWRRQRDNVLSENRY